MSAPRKLTPKQAAFVVLYRSARALSAEEIVDAAMLAEMLEASEGRDLVRIVEDYLYDSFEKRDPFFAKPRGGVFCLTPEGREFAEVALPEYLDA